MSNEEYEIYPLTVFKDRYQGVYSGGTYLAFNLDPHEIHEDAVGDDSECRAYFGGMNDAEPRETASCGVIGPYGRGESVEEAILDLRQRLHECGMMN